MELNNELLAQWVYAARMLHSLKLRGEVTVHAGK